MSSDTTVCDHTALNAERILVVTSELPPGPGGIGAHAFDLAAALAVQGRTVSLLGAQHYVSDADRDRFNEASPVTITTFADRGDPARTAAARHRQFLAALDSKRPHVVVASGGRVLWLAASACARRQVPFVAVVHGSELGGPKWQQTLTRWALNRSAVVLAVSNFTARLTEALGVPPSRIEVIHNGADGARFRPDPAEGDAFRQRHGLGSGPIVLTVGNVTERKGQHQVVAALPMLARSVPDVTYVLVGRPTRGDEILQQAQALGMSGHVRVLGQLSADEVTAAHQAATVFAMTSTATAEGDVEGFGIAVLEAALSGVPAVVTRGTGAEEAVADGVTGLVTDPDPAAVATTLGTLLGDPKRRVDLGESALRQARQTGTWKARAEEYASVLDRLAGPPCPSVLVVSHTEHYRGNHGLVGFGPTVREIDQLASAAGEVVHVAPLHPGPPPGMALAYQARNVRLVPMPPAGGNASLRASLRAVMAWVQTLRREFARADLIHVRAPAGISFVALFMMTLRRNPRARWVKYAGNWKPDGPDPRSYQLQRWLLHRNLTRSMVTVNGRWPDQPRWVATFDNPTLTDEEIERGRLAAASRPLSGPARLVFAGRLETAKGADRVIEALLELVERGVDVHLDMVGDGSQRVVLERAAFRLSDRVTFHGWLGRQDLDLLLSKGTLLLLPSQSEGFPKVVAEAMAFGCVPLTTDVSGIRRLFEETGAGRVLEPGERLDHAVEALLTDPALPAMAANGVAAAPRFSYATYLDRLRSLDAAHWHIGLKRDSETRG